jgi:nitrogen fixation/metabolism regulation signal transduction histidine kinase
MQENNSESQNHTKTLEYQRKDITFDSEPCYMIILKDITDLVRSE